MIRLAKVVLPEAVPPQTPVEDSHHERSSLREVVLVAHVAPPTPLQACPDDSSLPMSRASFSCSPEVLYQGGRPVHHDGGVSKKGQDDGRNIENKSVILTCFEYISQLLILGKV